jgi:hypothetical protein
MREAGTAISTASEGSGCSDSNAMGRADDKKRLNEPKILIANHCHSESNVRWLRFRAGERTRLWSENAIPARRAAAGRVREEARRTIPRNPSAWQRLAFWPGGGHPHSSREAAAFRGQCFTLGARRWPRAESERQSWRALADAAAGATRRADRRGRRRRTCDARAGWPPRKSDSNP